MNGIGKRAFDIAASTFLLACSAPTLLVVALLIGLESGRPVLFRQVRLGKNARTFTMYKFRTMIRSAEQRGPSITVGSDPRVTRVGRLLRRFELDELPSLWNVLKGDMSIVGPRPEVPKFLPYYTAAQRRVFDVRPGLTSPETLAFREEASVLSQDDPEQTYIREILPRKLALSVEYIDRRTLGSDLVVICKTLARIVSRPKG